MQRRVVVTGLGITMPGCYDVKSAWDVILGKKSFISTIENFNSENFTTKIAGEIKFSDKDYEGKSGIMYENKLDLSTIVEKKEIKKNGNFILYGIHAANQAIQDAGLDEKVDKSRVSVLVGSGIGGLDEIERSHDALKSSGPRRISPFFLPATLINLLPGQISIQHGFKGISYSIVSACATASHSIGEGARAIMCDDADVCIVGASESAITPLGISGFNAMRALSSDFNNSPEKASRPWDKARDGFVMGEGAGILVLEEYEHAKKRGAKIYAELAGYGATSDASHITAPHAEGEGGRMAAAMSLKKAGIDSSQIGYINAHGTSTPLGDEAELKGIINLMNGDMSKVSISSTKSATGHLLGAAGGIEAIFTILAIKDGVCPPTINLEDPCDVSKGIDLCANEVREKNIEYAISNSFGFGGCNASLLFKKFK